MRVTTKKQEPIPKQQEEEGKRDFPISYIKVREENKEINEENILSGWMQKSR